jgi:oxidase EvaA
MKKLFLQKWISRQNKNHKMQILKINKKNLISWKFTENKIFNIKKIFFSIVPFKFYQKNFEWYQPLIIQKEVGILGILKKKIRRKDHYLLQAKIEPGNKNGIQLSPTVQATKSNYLRKHGGKKTRYLDFFVKKNSKLKILSKLKLSEQGTKFLNKLNNNVLIDLKSIKIKKLPSFIWLSKDDLKYFLHRKNLLNMDTISVLSSIIKKNNYDRPLNKYSLLIKKLQIFQKEHQIFRYPISFSKLIGWKVLNDKIIHKKKNFFSILFLKILSDSREVKFWDQPILSDYSSSFNGLLIKKINNTYHYLLQTIFESGMFKPKYTSTVIIRNFNYNVFYKKVKYQKFFKKKFSHKFINSDEGGRFYQNETINVISDLNKKDTIKLSKNFVWVSHNQFVKLIKQNLISIEARNLFASFNIDNIK